MNKVIVYKNFRSEAEYKKPEDILFCDIIIREHRAYYETVNLIYFTILMTVNKSSWKIVTK